jgi:hypothetical protein
MEKAIVLPKPRFKGELSLEEAMLRRRSTRVFSSKTIAKSQLSQLLWACQGIRRGYDRTVPSAGATYPLEVFVLLGEGGVESLEAGVYRYLPQRHSIEPHLPGDLRKDLCSACLGQGFIRSAPVSFVVCSEYSRMFGIFQNNCSLWGTGCEIRAHGGGSPGTECGLAGGGLGTVFRHGRSLSR